MKSFSELAMTRRSIRKFEKTDIPANDIKEFIRIASSAPSGCNSQCWKFVAVKDPAVVSRIKDAVISKIHAILEPKRDELSETYLESKNKIATFFTKAPVVIAVFMTPMGFYDPTMKSIWEEQGLSYGEMMRLLAYPDLLSIGAAVQNLLLAVHEKGYGACWMNEPAVAAEEISKILGMPEDHKFVSLIPIGIPAYTPREKDLKGLDEILTII